MNPTDWKDVTIVLANGEKRPAKAHYAGDGWCDVIVESDGLTARLWVLADGSTDLPMNPCRLAEPFPLTPLPDRTLPVTPAERFCATMLRAWKEWASSETAGTPVVEATSIDVTRALRNRGWIDAFDFSPPGRELLARAEAAPEPDPTTAIVAFLRAEETKFRKEATRLAEQGRARCESKASVLATVAAYIERGDHLTTPIDAPPRREP